MSRARFSPNFHFTYVIPNRLYNSHIFQWIIEGIPNSKERFNSDSLFYFSSQGTFSILYVSCVNIRLQTFDLLLYIVVMKTEQWQVIIVVMKNGIYVEIQVHFFLSL